MTKKDMAKIGKYVWRVARIAIDFHTGDVLGGSYRLIKLLVSIAVDLNLINEKDGKTLGRLLTLADWSDVA